MNCGACGHACALPHAVAACDGGACAVGSCLEGFWDVDGLPGNGCEVGPCVPTGPETCNGLDDDCNGLIDEGLDAGPPATCPTLGACAGASSSCSGGRWRCNFGPQVSVDALGDLVPETACDGLDNDCNGVVDDAHPLKGAGCTDGLKGECQGHGVFQCDPANPTHPVVCVITDAGAAPQPEVCNGKDDDCNGVIDDGADAGALQLWASLGGGRQMLAYEASRPDSTAQSAGAREGWVCARAGALPWTNLEGSAAEAACASIGARLCTPSEWQRACAVVPAVQWPLVEPGSGSGEVDLEAEDYFSRAAVGGHQWEIAHAGLLGYSGMGVMRAEPDNGTSIPLANAAAQSPRIDYAISFTTAGTHYVWAHLGGQLGGHVYLGLDNTLPGAPTESLTNPAVATWNWVRSGPLNVAATGTAYVSFWMGEDGIQLDALAVTQSPSATPPSFTNPAGNAWAYASGPNVYAPSSCNGLDFDTDAGASGDQNGLLPTGSRPACEANWGAPAPFDLSGNAAEWTADQGLGRAQVRGGSSWSIAQGLRCDEAGDWQPFTGYRSTRVGFRCCR